MINNNMYGYGRTDLTTPFYGTPQPQIAQPVYPSQYGTAGQQYGTQQQTNNNSSGYVMVDNETDAMDSKYPINTPLFDVKEDVFYFKTYSPDTMHVTLKKARFFWEENDVIDAPNYIEQKDTIYGDSAKDEKIDALEKAVQDLTGQVNALVELQLEQQSESDKQAKTATTAKKTGNK